MGSEQIPGGRVNDQGRDNAPAAAWLPLLDLVRTAAGAANEPDGSRINDRNQKSKNHP